MKTKFFDKRRGMVAFFCLIIALSLIGFDVPVACCQNPMEVLFNNNITNEAHGQNEPMIAINPLHDNFDSMDIHVAVGANDYRNDRSIPGLYVSQDLNTWTTRSVATPYYDAFGNPALAYDSQGNLYYAYMAFDVDYSGLAYRGTIYVAKSADEGQTWIQRSPGVYWNEVSSAGYANTYYNDRPWIAIDQENDNVYMTWTLWRNRATANAYSYIMFSRSTDGGAHFSTPTQLSPTTTTQQRQWSKIAIGPNGEIYVVYRRFGVGASRALITVTSTDYGQTFGQESIILEYPDFTPTDYKSTGDTPATCCWPQIAVGPEGNLYLAWHSEVAEGDRDFHFSKSTDGGAHWSSQIKVASNTKDQFWPTITVSPGGRVGAIWYDRRDDLSNNLFHLYYTGSIDQGESFSNDIVRVTTSQSSQTVPFNPGASRYIGDYICIAETGDGVPLAVWTDTRDGNQEIYIAAISLPPTVSLSINPPIQYSARYAWKSYTVTVTSLINTEQTVVLHGPVLQMIGASVHSPYCDWNDGPWPYTTQLALQPGETKDVTIRVRVSESGFPLTTAEPSGFDVWAYTSLDCFYHTVARTQADFYIAGQTAQSMTGTGTVEFSPDNGGLTELEAVDEATLPTAGKPEGVTFPDGLFTFTITLESGSTVTVSIYLPSDVPVGSQYWKYQDDLGWFSIPIGSDDGDNVITITLTDGEIGDADGLVNGIIVDPGGLGMLAATPIPDFLLAVIIAAVLVILGIITVVLLQKRRRKRS